MTEKEAVNEAEAHVTQRLSARATHLIAAARQSFDPETLRQIEIAEANGATLLCIADGKGRVSVALFDGAHVIAALYEVDGEGRSVVRSLRAKQ
ncbi:hypothetical protein [Paraburkholderia sp. MM5477-R1]|uniref:hypothetical protein n=1 Tax=Paraburkholderia sp. MM5477-R1 TaxID=2991062 RepID=UPI003D1A8D68